jgi:hypothetical protein
VSPNRLAWQVAATGRARHAEEWLAAAAEEEAAVAQYTRLKVETYTHEEGLATGGHSSRATKSRSAYDHTRFHEVLVHKGPAAWNAAELASRLADNAQKAAQEKAERERVLAERQQLRSDGALAEARMEREAAAIEAELGKLHRLERLAKRDETGRCAQQHSTPAASKRRDLAQSLRGKDRTLEKAFFSDVQRLAVADDSAADFTFTAQHADPLASRTHTTLHATHSSIGLTGGSLATDTADAEMHALPSTSWMTWGVPVDNAHLGAEPSTIEPTSGPSHLRSLENLERSFASVSLTTLDHTRNSRYSAEHLSGQRLHVDTPAVSRSGSSSAAASAARSAAPSAGSAVQPDAAHHPSVSFSSEDVLASAPAVREEPRTRPGSDDTHPALQRTPAHSPVLNLHGAQSRTARAGERGFGLTDSLANVPNEHERSARSASPQLHSASTGPNSFEVEVLGRRSPQASPTPPNTSWSASDIHSRSHSHAVDMPHVYARPSIDGDSSFHIHLPSAVRFATDTSQDGGPYLADSAHATPLNLSARDSSTVPYSRPQHHVVAKSPAVETVPHHDLRYTTEGVNPDQQLVGDPSVSHEAHMFNEHASQALEQTYDAASIPESVDASASHQAPLPFPTTPAAASLPNTPEQPTRMRTLGGSAALAGVPFTSASLLASPPLMLQPPHSATALAHSHSIATAAQRVTAAPAYSSGASAAAFVAEIADQVPLHHPQQCVRLAASKSCYRGPSVEPWVGLSLGACAD